MSTSSPITTLSSGQITTSDMISVELAGPANMPAVVRIVWPSKATVVNPRQFPDTAAMIARLFAEAATTLAGIRAKRRR